MSRLALYSHRGRLQCGIPDNGSEPIALNPSSYHHTPAFPSGQEHTQYNTETTPCPFQPSSLESVLPQTDVADAVFAFYKNIPATVSAIQEQPVSLNP